MSTRHVVTSYLPRAKREWLAAGRPPGWEQLDATLVFADVSGFTALSEALAATGRVGSEVLTDVLNGVYAELSEAGMALGGDVVGFGGDALLLLFEGDGHGLRARAAAWDMQLALGRLANVETEAGTVRLGMRIGVAGGPVDLFLCGEDHFELALGGEVTSRVVALEGAAPVGGVLTDEGPLDARPEPGPVPERPEPDDEAVAATGMPTQLRGHLGTVAEGEHRRVAIGFVQLRELDGLLAERGPDAAWAAIDGLVRAGQRAAAEHGVTFLYTDVDAGAVKLLLLAGAPVARGDDADRLLLALSDVLAHPHGLPVRAGAHRGAAFVVDVGTSRRRHFTVMGDPVNLAARLMGQAGDGELLASAELLEHVRLPFATDPTPPLQVKGKAEAVRAARIGLLAEGPVALRATPAEPLLGRTPELALLAGLVHDARDGAGGIAELVGEAGIGKSALLASALEAAAGRPVLLVEGRAYGAASPYRALRTPLRALLGAPRDDDATTEAALRAWIAAEMPDLEPALPLIGLPFGLDLPASDRTRRLAPEFARRILEQGVVRVVEALLPERVAVLAVEDAHWLDEASAALLQRLLGRATERSWAGVVTRRAETTGLVLDADTPGLQRVELSPLSADAALELVERRGTHRLAPQDVEGLIRRSHGNPLFLSELVDAAHEEGLAALPDTVEALIAARIDTLGPPERQALRTAAVLGTRVRRSLLVDLLDDEGRAGLDRLLDRGGFLTASGPDRLLFRHALVRDAAYEALPHRRRRELHGRVGDALLAAAGTEADELAAELSLHFHAGERWAESWTWSRRAGERALRAAAPIEGVDLFGRAFEAGLRLEATEPATLVALAEQTADAADLAGRYETAVEVLRRAEEAAGGDRLLRARMVWRHGRQCDRTGQYEDALGHHGQALDLLEGLAEDDALLGLRARATLDRGAVLVRLGRLEEAVPLLTSAHAELAVVGERSLQARAASLLDWALTDLGRPDDRYRTEALAIWTELDEDEGLAMAYNNLGIDRYYEGRWAEALECYAKAKEARERQGDVVRIAELENNVGEVLSDQGHLDAAEEAFVLARRHWEVGPVPAGLALVTANLGRVATRRGAFDEAAGLLQDAHRRFSDLGAEAFLLDVRCRQAELLVLSGRPDAALALLETLRDDVARDRGQPNLLAMVDRLRGRAHHLRAEHDAARAALESSLGLSTEAGLGFEEAATRRALADLGADAGWPDAAEHARRADEAFAALGVVAPPEHPPGRRAP